MEPSVHLLLRSRRRDEVLEMVEAGTADFGIIPGADRRTDLEYEPLFPYERVLIAPKGHPLLQHSQVTLEEIAQLPLILLGPRTYTRALLEGEFQRRGLRYDVVLELDSMDMIKRYVTMGMGISVGPALAIEKEDLDEIGIAGLGHLLPVEQVVVVTLRGRYLPPAAQQFRAVLKRDLRGR